MRFIARIACLALPLALALPAEAQDASAGADARTRLEIDTNLFCDTRQQVERFVTLLDENGGSAEAAIEQVSAENDTRDVCVIATAAYRRAGVVGTVKNLDATFDITRIEVLGVYTANGLERSPPTEFFMLAPRRGEDGTVGQGGQ